MKQLFYQLFQSKNPGIIFMSRQHLSIIFSLIFLIFLLIYFKNDIRNNIKCEFVIRSILVVMILIQQILLYSWYLFTGYFSIKEALPLYPCRICDILCIVLLLKKNEKLFPLLFYWGLSGATLALLSPDTSNLGFPNAMFIQFFIGHIGIILSIVFMMIADGYIPRKESLLSNYKISIFYVIFILIFNRISGGNYAYLRTLPQVDFLAWLPRYPYFVPIFVAFNFLLFAIMHYIWVKIERKKIALT